MSKGDKNRVTDLNAFRKNHDGIDWKKKKSKKGKNNAEKTNRKSDK